MPLVASAVTTYAAGLLAGIGNAPGWSLLAMASVIVLASLPRDRLALVAVGVGGLAAGHVTADTERACAARELVAQQWTVVLESDASPGAFVRARHDCGSVSRLAVVDGNAVAGARVAATGDVTRGRTGLLMTDAAVRQVDAPSLAPRWRARIGRGIDGIFGVHAPLVRALLIADMRELSPSVRERFAAAGLSHMLSVSGLHVGLIAAAVLLLAQVAGVGRTRAEVFAAVLTAAYVVLIGAPLPAVRSALMLGAVSLSRMVQRPTSAWAVLAVGAGLPLMEPRAVVDVGYQLSVVGMVALVAAGALSKRWQWLAEGGWRGTLYRSLVTSVIATLFTAPLVAAVFGRVSLVAPLTNLAAVPVMALLQPMLFLAALLLPFAEGARFVADACTPLLEFIDRLATLGATLPGASIPVLADRLSLAVACGSVAGLAVACVSRFPGRALVCVAAGCAIVAWRPLLPVTAGVTELHMLDVGQGDALALRTTRGRWVLFDAGRDWDGGDEGRRTAVPYIASRGGAVHAFVLSHPHSDHVGGAASVIDALRPAIYVDPGYAGSSRSYRASLEAARARGVRWMRVRPGDSLVVDEAVITFLAPAPAWADSLADPNDASTVARIRVGAVSMLMTGDAEREEEEWLLGNRAGELRSDVLKVAHHGSNTSSTGAFLDAVRPRVALIPVGAGNLYGHPSPEILRSLATRGVLVLRTDRHGPVIARTDGRAIEMEAMGERWTVR